MPGTPISAVLAPAYQLGLERLSVAELRARRTQCALVESSVSYERQLIQGRLDIVRDEQNRRDDNAVSGDTRGLVQRLPAIITLHAHAPGVGRPPTFLFPVHLDLERLDRLHRIAPASALGALATLSAADLLTMSSQLERMEEEISAERRALHLVHHRIQQEVIRRYRAGEEPIQSAVFGAPQLMLTIELERPSSDPLPTFPPPIGAANFDDGGVEVFG